MSQPRTNKPHKSAPPTSPAAHARKDGGEGNEKRADRSVGKPSKEGTHGDGQPNAASGSTR